MLSFNAQPSHLRRLPEGCFFEGREVRDRVMGADYTHFAWLRQTPESPVCSVAPSGHNSRI